MTVVNHDVMIPQVAVGEDNCVREQRRHSLSRHTPLSIVRRRTIIREREQRLMEGALVDTGSDVSQWNACAIRRLRQLRKYGYPRGSSSDAYARGVTPTLL